MRGSEETDETEDSESITKLFERAENVIRRGKHCKKSNFVAFDVKDNLRTQVRKFKDCRNQHLSMLQCRHCG